ncbi:MAG: exo-alpha-sialidase [Proteobacteria bacterium]|nr:exo-alpha-sialidase [Pseudomonadota bacterium]
MSEQVLRLIIIVAGWLLILLGVFESFHPPQPSFAALTHGEPNGDGDQTSAVPVYREDFLPAGSPDNAEVHAATAHGTSRGIMAYWYGGSREGAADVVIYQAEYQDGAWGTPSPITDRARVQRDLSRYVRKVGNPVSWQLNDGRIWVLFVSVSAGGWAGSAINLIESSDGGRSWSETRRLVTSPFLNLSTLVRNSPVQYADGTIGVPVYHEFIGKFCELLRLDPNGRIVDKVRLSHGAHSLQPALTAISPDEAVALLRHSGAPPMHVLESWTNDGGLTFSPPRELSIENPDSAIATLAFGDTVLAALNPLSDTENGRHTLSLAIRDEHGSWRLVHTIEREPDWDVNYYEYSYPSLARDHQGLIHLVYTWNRQRIKHVVFNDAWLLERLQ